MKESLLQNNRTGLGTLLNEPLTFAGGLLLFLMVFTPTYNVALKIILIIIVLAAIILSRISFYKLSITRPVLVWYLLFIGHGLFFTIISFINHNNTYYILRTTTYNIVWPILYLIFTIGLYKKSSLIFLIRVLVIANFIIPLYLLGSALTLLHILPELPLVKFDMTEVDYETGMFKLQVPAIMSMMFTVPFIFSLALLCDKEAFGFKKWFLYLSVILSVAGAISTVRRALLLNIFLGIFFTIVFSWFSRREARRTMKQNLIVISIFSVLILSLVITAAQQAGVIDFDLISKKFFSAFASEQTVADKSVAIRYNQVHYLIKSWLQNPLLGHGHGAVSSFIIRSVEKPWIYELTYIALLFQTGIIGLLTYLAILSWPIIKGLQLVKERNAETTLMVIPVIVGCICFLIANGTNPYLQSYDCMWALFFPVAIINYLLKEKL